MRFYLFSGYSLVILFNLAMYSIKAQKMYQVIIKNLGMSLFLWFLGFHVCLHVRAPVCVFYWSLLIRTLRLVFQYDVQRALRWWWDFYNIIRGLFGIIIGWVVRNRGLLGHCIGSGKEIITRKISSRKSGLGKSFLESLTWSKRTSEDHVTLELIFFRVMWGVPNRSVSYF